jgi:choline dehydrogenase-like flavoprotein
MKSSTGSIARFHLSVVIVSQLAYSRPASRFFLGGTITGTNVANSVVNSFGQTHEVPNLYVAGPGIFPTCGASNPTCTVFALSLRSAENLVELGHACVVIRNGADRRRNLESTG